MENGGWPQNGRRTAELSEGKKLGDSAGIAQIAGGGAPGSSPRITAKNYACVSTDTTSY